MPERTLREDHTAVTFILPAGTPTEDGKRAFTTEPSPENHPSSRYLAAGDYWFNNDSTQDGESSSSGLHT
ncbi:hypothetical protein ACFQ7B_19230 [Streptomyces erythrochromogenes]|uniref:hypothetical protein n=1 Tax=Streptomyces erythrochromogenes TaxID=285574 RepID=UPI003682D4EC